MDNAEYLYLIHGYRLEGLSWTKIGLKLDESAEKVRSTYRRATKKGFFDSPDPTASVPSEEAALTFADRKVVDDVDWREFADLAISVQSIEQRLDDSQHHAEIHIKTDTPIAVVYSADWHLGDMATDHVSWLEDMRFILDTPEIYIADLGDDRQNMRSFFNLAGVLNQALSPKQQALMVRSLIDELTAKDKLLFKVDGNHDVEFDERLFGQAVQSYLLEKMKAPRFNNRGLVKFYVGKQLYTMLVFHKSRFSSFLRAAHGAMREYQLSFPADVVVGGHDHRPAFELQWHYTLAQEAGFPFGGESYLIKTGTYQTDSGYGWKYFHNGGIAIPTVVFYPDQRKMVPFINPRDAVQFLRSSAPGRPSPAD